MLFSLPHAHLDYVPPKLHRGKTSWYISYYVKNPATGKLKLFRVKVNRYHNQKERIQAAKEIMAGLQERLALGWNPMVSKAAPMATVPAFQVFDTYLRVKSKEMEKQSYATYASYVRIFRGWLESQGCTGTTPISSITEGTARKYMNYLETEKSVSPRSYNNYLSFMVTFMDWMKDKGYIQENVFTGIKRKPRRLMAKKRRMLTDEELGTLFTWLQENNPEYLAVCLLCYCCFMRPKEIALLRCSDIDLERQVIHVAADVAKNGNESFRTIPSAIVPMLQQLDLSSPALYLFGRHDGEAGNFAPGPVPVSEKKFADFWKWCVRKGCGFGLELQLYSLKDTGITRMLGEKVPISFVQQQADHQSVAMTAIYVGKSPVATDILKGVNILPD